MYFVGNTVYRYRGFRAACSYNTSGSWRQCAQERHVPQCQPAHACTPYAAMQSASVEPKKVSDSTADLLAAMFDGLVPTNTQPAGKVRVRCVASQTSRSVTCRPTARLLVVSVRLPVREMVLNVPLSAARSSATEAA